MWMGRLNSETFLQVISLLIAFCKFSPTVILTIAHSPLELTANNNLALNKSKSPLFPNNSKGTSEYYTNSTRIQRYLVVVLILVFHLLFY